MALDIINAGNYVRSSDGITHIDLTDVDFVLPGGSVALACFARDAQQRGMTLEVTGPASDQVARYASRIGLGEVFAECGVPGTLPAVSHWDRGDVLVECQWAADAAIDGLSLLVSDRLWDAEVDAETTDLVSSAVYEVADNVKTHAGSGGGFISAQTYQRGTPYERVEVAVGDIGCGVRTSLEARHSPSDDQHALQLATTESVTRLPQDRRGLGLHYVARDIPRAGGRLTIRSGSAYLHVHPKGRFSTNCASVAGTLVEIRVPVGGLGKGSNR